MPLAGPSWGRASTGRSSQRTTSNDRAEAADIGTPRNGPGALGERPEPSKGIVSPLGINHKFCAWARQRHGHLVAVVCGADDFVPDFDVRVAPSALPEEGGGFVGIANEGA